MFKVWESGALTDKSASYKSQEKFAGSNKMMLRTCTNKFPGFEE